MSDTKISLPTIDQIVAIHDIALARHGGRDGLRSADALAGAWARAETFAHYHPDADARKVIATLATGIVKAHAFSDGNKRTAYGALVIGLVQNGMMLKGDISPEVVADRIIAAAAGDGSPDLLDAWLQDHAVPDDVYKALFDYDARGPESDAL